MLKIHPAARKHGISDSDIEHAVKHAMVIDELEESKLLYLGPACDAGLLEVVMIRQGRNSAIAIHAMKVRRKYWRLFIGGEK
jgi:hypothetical protein